ncbi:B-box zinc finger protein, putative [Eimeria maxima]|uniref:B-box zinc finger protein, putative n=1 Tax=Eimeria maxima TaxID=5804 RepID=U6M128_EIMMA|nr:B-box zinc finger protein, putative [Eimeria maxima]CDJ56129.1 B-box zinc finger protein, putative [Eimeria maxima]
MDLRALDDPPPLEIAQISDINVLSCWEQWLKLSFSTSDLHIVRAWTLQSRATEIAFEEQARALRGPIVYSFLDRDRIPGPVSLEEVIEGTNLSCNWAQLLYPVGALEAPPAFAACPASTFKILACKIATGSTLAHQDAEGDFEKRKIPANYSSLALVQSSPSTNEAKILRMLYRVKESMQVLPLIIIEYSLQLLLIEVSSPLCDLCHLLPSSLFCPADKAHLCDACDLTHHSASRLLARHRRLPAAHSPFQFGQCPNHPSEMLDCVCMVCFVALCPHCILIGHHSAADFSEHPLISTLDAYKMSMQGTSPSEEAVNMRREKIIKDLQENHRLLARLHANFASVHRKIDDSNK